MHNLVSYSHSFNKVIPLLYLYLTEPILFSCIVSCKTNVLFNSFWRKFLLQVCTETLVESTHLHFNITLFNWFKMRSTVPQLVSLKKSYFKLLLWPILSTLQCMNALTHGCVCIILLILWGKWTLVRSRGWQKH